MNKKIILFDWDDTLISKKVYKNNLVSNLARICEVSYEQALIIDNEYFDNLIKSGDFMIENYLKCFEKKFNKKIVLGDFNTDKLKIYSKALFPEVIEFLEKIKNKYSLGIYSQGFESLQRIKIKYSGIEFFFDQKLIFINRDKTQLNFVNKIPIQATVIDDKKEVIETLKQLRPDLELVWINRINQEKMNKIKTIKSLNELF
jgi:phosphoglycolate phosphatase-like HAD superfamily hydrolase